MEADFFQSWTETAKQVRMQAWLDKNGHEEKIQHDQCSEHNKNKWQEQKKMDCRLLHTPLKASRALGQHYRHRLMRWTFTCSMTWCKCEYLCEKMVAWSWMAVWTHPYWWCDRQQQQAEEKGELFTLRQWSFVRVKSQIPLSLDWLTEDKPEGEKPPEEAGIENDYITGLAEAWEDKFKSKVSICHTWAHHTTAHSLNFSAFNPFTRVKHWAALGEQSVKTMSVSEIAHLGTFSARF